jgi:type II secretory pathway pseudopilin PulG
VPTRSGSPRWRFSAAQVDAWAHEIQRFAQEKAARLSEEGEGRAARKAAAQARQAEQQAIQAARRAAQDPQDKPEEWIEARRITPGSLWHISAASANRRAGEGPRTPRKLLYRDDLLPLSTGLAANAPTLATGIRKRRN